MKRFMSVLMLLLAGQVMAGTLEVSIINMKYEPEELTIKPGDTVRWVNKEKRTYHSVLFKAEGLPESEPLFPGETHQRIFDQPGTYSYECGPHPNMQGRILVKP